MAELTQEYSTILGADANFKGEMSVDGGAKILGKFEGSINGKGRINVGDGCRLKASVKAKEVTVEGQVDGNVEAADRVELKTKGSIVGDISAIRMSMADGASIDGHCRIGVSSKGSVSTEVKPSAQAQQTVAVKK
ncbi:MAG: polymer-forming cytoskeletal protein [Phycisphaerales bacterium]|nr:polymer-forming cytoskeletal protein [Phycisphaerales bacterium]MCI0630140.1 polymer-forming cytoskeletal protein [Phycisphaerales bacterium]MCI0675939.1 polymer-forming cytoskeletal protein [Phycisphaerales bacterium]